jgi:serine protease Do
MERPYLLTKNRRKSIVAGLIVLLLTAGGAVAATAAGSDGVPLDAKVINGEVYVKASSLVAQLGGNGTFDKASKKYIYNPGSQVPEVVKKVSPSVVAIIGKPEDLNSDNRFSLAHGTGVIVKSDGWIVTNAHVVKDMSRIVVVTADGKEYEGTRKQIDVTSDLAFVKINAKGLKPATFAPTPLQTKVGETVVAIGTPVSFTLRNTATVGVISGMNRSVDSYYNLLQTDAAINPGNSGGPLVNLKGEIVGINSMKFVDVDIDSMGFAIPADTVQYVLGHFNKYGKVMRPSLGLELEESWAAIVGLPTEEPMKITAVSSPSAKNAGINPGDQLYSVAGKQVSTIIEVNELLKPFLPGQKVEVTLLTADGDLMTHSITLAASSAQ